MKRNNPLRRYSLLSITLASLSGCTPYSESFDCPPGQGVGCKSLNVINQMVEEGKLPLEGVPLEGNEAHENNSRERGFPTGELIEANNGLLPHALVKVAPQIPPSRVPSRTTHIKVWMAAYEDEGGVFHASSMIYVPLKKESPLGEKKLSQEHSQMNTLGLNTPERTTAKG